MDELKLNLGAGASPIDGYINLDRKNGNEIYPLNYPDNSVDLIRASHCLEHFPSRETAKVLADWVRALKPGGSLKIAVPDFAKCAKWYLDGTSALIGSYIMGGQTDDDDYHKWIFDSESLTQMMQKAGLENITVWESDAPDCSSLEVSLNLQGTKPLEVSAAGIRSVQRKIEAVMSVPRIGWNDTWGCIYAGIVAPGIRLNKGSGVFWGQVLSRMMCDALERDADYIIAVDYDSIFTRENVMTLCELMELYPEVDAIVPVQVRRESGYSMFGIQDEHGKAATKVSADIFDQPLTKITLGHFGLTILRGSSLRKMPKPWFLATANADGEWEDGRVDEDIHFWNQAKAAGLTVCLANEVRIGHIQMMVSWPDREFAPVHQFIGDWNEKGGPKL